MTAMGAGSLYMYKMWSDEIDEEELYIDSAYRIQKERVAIDEMQVCLINGTQLLGLELSRLRESLMIQWECFRRWNHE